MLIASDKLSSIEPIVDTADTILPVDAKLALSEMISDDCVELTN